jgi:exo-beta-1,3-glucanase (GH17 family)
MFARHSSAVAAVLIAIFISGLAGDTPASARQLGSGGPASASQPLRCLAFSPYVAGYDPDNGPHPPPALIDELLDRVVYQAGFRCIMIYGVLNGLDYIFQAAEARGIKVIEIIWLDTDPAVNAASTSLGIQKAQDYPNTIIRVACGSEVRVRHGAAVAQPIVQGCIDQARAASVTQPVGSIDTWWGWCNESSPCQQWGLASEVDWIGINVFPWWENKYSGIYPCTTAAQAADFHIARLQELTARYPDKEVIMTEFGWPAGPDGYTEQNENRGQSCGVASEANQRLVIESTLRKLDALGLPGVVFEGFKEPWKARPEPPIGPHWGVCAGSAPYACPIAYGLRSRVYIPAVSLGLMGPCNRLVLPRGWITITVMHGGLGLYHVKRGTGRAGFHMGESDGE